MENIEYANAYSEVLEILKNISKEDYEKVPSEKIDLFEKNANKNYIGVFEYNGKKYGEKDIYFRPRPFFEGLAGICFIDKNTDPYQMKKVLEEVQLERTALKEKRDTVVSNLTKYKTIEQEKQQQNQNKEKKQQL